MSPKRRAHGLEPSQQNRNVRRKNMGNPERDWSSWPVRIRRKDARALRITWSSWPVRIRRKDARALRITKDFLPDEALYRLRGSRECFIFFRSEFKLAARPSTPMLLEPQRGNAIAQGNAARALKGSSRNNFTFCCGPCGPQPAGARRRACICFVAAPRRCPTSPSSRRLASARPALAPKCEFISARALSALPQERWR